jgi:hypothetical protein
MRKTIGLCFIVSFSICTNQLWAQSHAPKAPLAQKLADELVARHQPELLSVEVNLVPPGGAKGEAYPTSMIIVAATDQSIIGQESVCADPHAFGEFPFLVKGGAGRTIAGKVIGNTYLATLHDQKGNTIGAVNLRFTLEDATEAAKLGRSIERELAGEIPSESALYASAQ